MAKDKTVMAVVTLKVDARAYAREYGIPLDEVEGNVANEVSNEMGDALTWYVASVETAYEYQQRTGKRLVRKRA